jgi:hypothetical protein
MKEQGRNCINSRIRVHMIFMCIIGLDLSIIYIYIVNLVNKQQAIKMIINDNVIQ